MFHLFLTGTRIFADPLAKAVDAGFKQPVFDVVVEDNTLPVGWGYILPKGIYGNAAEVRSSE